MRILVTSDIHYALKQYDWLVSVAADYDLVILAGDLLDLSSMVEPRAQIVVVRAYLEELAALTRVVVCSGNHDLDGHNAAGERAASWMADLAEIGVLTDGQSVTIGDVLVTAFAWWDGPQGVDDISRQLAEAAPMRNGTWIWVYHAPPADAPVSWDGRRHFGDKELSAWIGEFGPDLVLSGHVHPAPFVDGGSWVHRVGETLTFNPGHQPGPVPAHIVLDLETSDAVWSSIEGMWSLSFDDPSQEPEPVRA